MAKMLVVTSSIEWLCLQFPRQNYGIVSALGILVCPMRLGSKPLAREDSGKLSPLHRGRVKYSTRNLQWIDDGIFSVHKESDADQGPQSLLSNTLTSATISYNKIEVWCLL